MQPFRKHIALAVDGGGIKGAIVTRALSILEKHLGMACHDIFRLSAGTSTGSIISAGIARGLNAREMDQLYSELGETIFKRTLRSTFFPLSRFRYSSAPLESLLKLYLGDGCLGDFWSADPATDVVITTFDLLSNHTRFLKPWKEEYRSWPLVKAVLASSTVPTYFPVVEGRYVDGGVGAYANPAYLAAYEIMYCLNWDPSETTLISIGTGRDPHNFDPTRTGKFFAWDWIGPVLGAFLSSADDQQVHLVKTFFTQPDFRRFQIDTAEPIGMDEPSKIAELQAYGEKMGQMILNDEVDQTADVVAKKVPVVGHFW
jgi:uncharacterized protein